jgi:hypothetical protein
MIIEVHGELPGMRKQFEDDLRAQCDTLAIPLDLRDGNTIPPSADAQVAVVFPTSGNAWQASDAARHPHYAGALFPILPVVADAPEAQYLPTSLGAFNAFQRGIWLDAWSVGLVDEVLSLGWQRRHERRVFVSYKRTDSGPVARQLHIELTRRGYLTFLDDISIEKGADFQRALKWSLNDADAVIVLVTPNFENSRWCMEEIAFAQSSTIGLLGVEWPGSVFGAPPRRSFPAVSSGPAAGRSVMGGIYPDQRLTLDEADFTGAAEAELCEQELNDAGLAKVLAHCARQRAKAIRQRLENLIPLAERVLEPKYGLLPAAEPGDFTFHDQAGVECYVRLLPFRPDARSVHETFASAGKQARVGCLYGESDVNDPRAVAMRWLTKGRHDSASVSGQAETRLWACIGDKVES